MKKQYWIAAAVLVVGFAAARLAGTLIERRDQSCANESGKWRFVEGETAGTGILTSTWTSGDARKCECSHRSLTRQVQVESERQQHEAE